MPITTDVTARTGLARRLGWFAGLWMVGVLSMGAAGLLIRWVLHP